MNTVQEPNQLISLGFLIYIALYFTKIVVKYLEM